MTKNMNDIQECQIKFEKVCHENQEKTHMINKLRREWNRLKSDLNFLYISRNLTNLHTQEAAKRVDADDADKEDMIVNSIQQSIAKIEEIESECDNLNKESSYNAEVDRVIDNLIKTPRHPTFHSRKFMFPDDVRRSSILLRTTEFSPPSSGSGTSTLTKPNIEAISTAADEEIKMTTHVTMNTEDSFSDRKDTELSEVRTEGDDEDGLQRIINNSGTDEEKLMELQNLIMSQRKTINSLSKMNAELTTSNHKFQANFDKRISASKKQISELLKFNSEKVKEYEHKIAHMKHVLEEQIKEVHETKLKMEKDAKTKLQSLNDLKFQNDKLQKIVSSNNLTKRVSELETRIKDYGLERQKLFEDLFKLRNEIDTKDDIISDKSAQIQILQNNLNTISSQLEILRVLHQNSSKQNINTAPGKERSELSRQNSLDKVQFFDKHIVKPLKGGGGNVKNFERNNFLIFEKQEFQEDDIPFTTRKKSTDVPSKSEALPITSARLKTDGNFKKFDEILKTMNSEDENSLSGGSDSDDDVKEMQKRFKNAGNPQNNSSNSMKGFFGTMKSFFA
jgi:hypothetical protein